MALPGALQNVAANEWPNMVAVEWDMLDATPVVTKYQIKKDAEAWIDLTDQDFSHEFHGLTNGQEYTFTVRAVNAEGNGPDSVVKGTPNGPVSGGGDGFSAPNPFADPAIGGSGNLDFADPDD